MSQRRRPTDGQPLQSLFREVDRRGRLQHDPRGPSGEDDERDLVPAQICVAEQREHGALGRLHALLGVHRRAGVDDEHDQRAGAPAADFLAQVLALQVQCRAAGLRRGRGAAAVLMRRGSPHGGVERDVGGLLRLRRPDVAATLVAALRRAALARRGACPPVARERDLAHGEELSLEELLGAVACHRLRRLLAALDLAGALALLAAARSRPGAGRPPPRTGRRWWLPQPPGRSPRNAPWRVPQSPRPSARPRPGALVSGARGRARPRRSRRQSIPAGAHRRRAASSSSRIRTTLSASSQARTVRDALLTTISARWPRAPASMHTSAMNQLIVCGDLGAREQSPRLDDDRAEMLLAALELEVETGAVDGPARVALHDPDALVDVAQTSDVDAETEAIEELRPELAFLRIHRADEDESRRVGERDALALDDIPCPSRPRRGGRRRCGRRAGSPRRRRGCRGLPRRGGPARSGVRRT